MQTAPTSCRMKKPHAPHLQKKRDIGWVVRSEAKTGIVVGRRGGVGGG